MTGLTREQAIAKHETRWWVDCAAPEIVSFQLYEDLLCMPFGEFHSAVEEALGRPVFTHEFALPDLLRKEFEKVTR